MVSQLYNEQIGLRIAEIIRTYPCPNGYGVDAFGDRVSDKTIHPMIQTNHNMFLQANRRRANFQGPKLQTRTLAMPNSNHQPRPPLMAHRSEQQTMSSGKPLFREANRRLLIV